MRESLLRNISKSMILPLLQIYLSICSMFALDGLPSFNFDFLVLISLCFTNCYQCDGMRIIHHCRNLSKHYFAPRATTKYQLYSCFQGTSYNIAERYTEMTRIVFLVYFYCVLDPFAFFLGVMVLVIR